jgi:Queuosine salvage protein
MQALREACTVVSERSEHVRIIPEAVAAYAAALPLPFAGWQRAQPLPPAQREAAAAFWLTLDAINFGSGWFPTLRKRPGLSGYNTIATALEEHVAAHGGWSAAQLSSLEPAELAEILGQDPDHELIALYARSLNDLGDHVAREHDGSFTAVVEAAGGSAVDLATQLGAWDCFADCSLYGELQLPFLKRAQIAAADLQRAGVTVFGDLGALTMFADNLVPHVLRLDGVLWFEPDLVARIERAELIAHDSPEEIEIRACAVQAVELLTEAAGDGSTAAQIDQLLWELGGQPRYKAVPRHRSRCTAY